MGSIFRNVLAPHTLIRLHFLKRSNLKFKNLQVQVNFRGTRREEFSRLTDTLPEEFDLQIRALEYIIRHGVNCYPACMVSFSPL